MEILKTMITIAAFAISALAFMFTRRTWYEANRPIVSAEIVTHVAGNLGITFNLVIYNTGNRPATNIRLSAVPAESLNSSLNPDAPLTIKKEILACFSKEGVIPILHQGKSVSNGFGNTSIHPEESTLVYNSIIPIKINYRDLHGKSYETKQDLIVKDSKYFAGSGWT